MPWELKNPAGLWLLALLAPLLALYILKIKRERVRVSSTWLWALAQRDILAQSPFKRLRAHLPLLVQASILVLLAVALSRPASRGSTLAGDRVAVIVDVSASMAAHPPGGPARIEMARDRARRVIEGLGPGSQAMIIEAGREARIASPLDRDKARLFAAIQALDVEHVEGQVAPAVALASDRLRAEASTKQIVVITDGAVTDPEALEASDLPLTIVKVGDELDNAGIIRVDTRRGIDPLTQREQVQAFALVANFGRARRDLFVTLRLRNVTEPLASRRLVLEPGERSPVVLSFEPTPGDADAGLVVELSPSDALGIDDRGYGKVPASRKLPVVLAPANASTWVRRALQADPDVDLVGSGIQNMAGQSVPSDALVVIEGACPREVAGLDLLVINPPPGACRTATVGEVLEQPSITSWSESDPRLRFVNLEGVSILKARRVETDGPREALVRARQGTLVSDISMPGRAGTLVAFDVGDSNWPLKASFVLFIRNVLETARTHRAKSVIGPARTGDALRIRVPAELSEVTLFDPLDRQQKLPAKDGLVVLPVVRRAGFYYLNWEGQRPGSVLSAANLTSDRESDLSNRIVGGPGSGREKSRPAVAENIVIEWSWLLAAAVLLLIAFDVWWLTRARLPLGGVR